MALKQGKFDEAFALYDANVETIQENGYGEKTFMIETLRLRASAGLSAKDDARIEQASRDAAEAQRILALQENANLQYEGLVTCLSGEIALAQGRLEDAAKDFAATEDKYGEIRAATPRTTRRRGRFRSRYRPGAGTSRLRLTSWRKSPA